jgi:hypothetical protein
MEKMVSFASSCLISILITMFLGTIEPKREVEGFLILFNSVIFIHSWEGSTLATGTPASIDVWIAVARL